MDNTIAFTNQQVDAAYVNSLVDLVNACREAGVQIENVYYYQHGWQVTFEGFDHADAICHNGSCGSPCYGGLYNPDVEKNDWSKTGRWETMGFPWDGIDVSVHSSRALAHMLAALRDGDDWEKYEYEDY